MMNPPKCKRKQDIKVVQMTISIKNTAKPKGKGAATYRVVYKAEWGKEFLTQPVPNDRHKFHCIPCGKDVSCHHQGFGDVKAYHGRDAHKKTLATLKDQKILHRFAPNQNEDTTFSRKVTKAEVMVTDFLVQYNLLMATADHLGPLLKDIFPDSSIASPYSCGRTKSSAILNEALASQWYKCVTEHRKTHPYSVGTNGSNDTGVKKMNPLTIRIFDLNHSKTVTNYFFLYELDRKRTWRKSI